MHRVRHRARGRWGGAIGRGSRPLPFVAGTGDGRLHAAQLLTILDGLPVTVMLRAADSSLLHINPSGVRFLERLGIGVEHIAASPTAMLDHVQVLDERGRDVVPRELPVVSSLRDASSSEATLGYALPGGGHAWYAVRAAPVTLADGTIGTVMSCDDVTARRQLEDDLRAAAARDPLTGVANRRALADRLLEAHRRRRRTGGEIGLLFLDLDGFKAVNDTYGHEFGDRLLVEIGRRLVAATREVDTVCRLGGDEFVVLCAPIDGRPGLHELVDRLRAWAPMVADTGESVPVQGSVGAVLVEQDEGLDRALRRADAAMYQAKRGTAAPDALSAQLVPS